jgi:hypothetical protein
LHILALFLPLLEYFNFNTQSNPTYFKKIKLIEGQINPAINQSHSISTKKDQSHNNENCCRQKRETNVAYIEGQS